MEASVPALPDKNAETNSIIKVRKTFQTADADGDGRMSRDEFIRLMENLDPGTWRRSSIDVLFQAADTDGSGYVEVQEFLDWVFLEKKEPKRNRKLTGKLFGDSESDDDSSSSSSEPDEETMNCIPEAAALSMRENVSRACSKESIPMGARHSMKSDHDIRSIQRTVKHEEPLTTVQEMYELLTMRDGKVGSFLVMEDMVNIFHESKSDGLGPRLSRLVRQQLLEVAGEPEDISVLEMVHLYQLLHENREVSIQQALSTIRAVKDECRAIDVSQRVRRNQEIKKLGVDLDASIGFGMFRRLLELLSVTMQIDQANILAIFAWVRTSRFEMTDEMGRAFMEHVFLKTATDDSGILEQHVSDNDFMRMCHSMKLIDAREKTGIAHGKLSILFRNVLKHMPRLRLERAARRYTDRGKLKSRPRKRKHGHRRIVGLTQLSILMEELYKKIPLNKSSIGSPMLLVLRCLETDVVDNRRGRVR